MLSSLLIPLTFAQSVILTLLTLVAAIAAYNLYSRYGLQKIFEIRGATDVAIDVMSFAIFKVMWLAIFTTSIIVYAHAIDLVDFLSIYFIVGVGVAIVATLFYIGKIAVAINSGKRNYASIVNDILFRHIEAGLMTTGVLTRRITDVVEKSMEKSIMQEIDAGNLLIDQDFIKLEINISPSIGQLVEKNFTKHSQAKLIQEEVDRTISQFKIVPQIEWSKLKVNWFIWFICWPIYAVIPLVWAFKKTIIVILNFSLNKFFTAILRTLLK